MGYVGGVCDRLYNYDSGLLSTTHLKAYVKKYGVTIILLARHRRIPIDEFSRRKKEEEVKLLKVILQLEMLQLQVLQMLLQVL